MRQSTVVHGSIPKGYVQVQKRRRLLGNASIATGYYLMAELLISRVNTEAPEAAYMAFGGNS